jgi:RHS repeat-associated protein
MRKIYSLVLFLCTLVSFSQNYHDTQGKLDITNSGQSTFTLPIALPPSINNVGPTINLTYSSGQTGGVSGQGWSLNSISSISRMATRFDIDGIRDGVDFDDNDKLSFDGQRLLIKTGTYWADGSTYETEMQSNTKVQLFGSGASMYFVVTSPDGSRSWYGNFGGVNATDLSSWYIVRYEDINGNFITYNYTAPFNNVFYVNEIRFSANTFSNNSPLNRIVFSYVNSARQENAYFKGVLINKSKILNNIKVYTNNAIFREYVIEHETDALLGYQRVKKVTEKNGAGESANPIEFTYDTTTSTNVDSESRKYYNNNFSFNSAQIGGDFDGDGRLDFIADNKLFTKIFDNSSGSNETVLPTMYYGTNPYLSNNKVLGITTLKNNKLNQQQSILSINTLNNSSTEFKVYDYTSNGVQTLFTKTINLDISVTQSLVNQTGTIYGVQCWSWLNSNASSYANNYKRYPSFFEGDFNGDAISEILISKPSNSLTITNQANTVPSSTPFNANFCNFSVSRGQNRFYLLDTNPNCGTSLGQKGFIEITDAHDCLNNIKYIADFNGDGKADILAIQPNGYYVVCEIYQTQNYGYTVLIGQGSFTDYSVNKQLFLGDYNGDGKTDVMMPNVSGNGCEDQPYCDDWYIYFSNPKPAGGEMFVRQFQNIVRYMPIRDDYKRSTINNSYYALDVNKDGKTDLVRIERVYYKPDWTINNHDTRWTVTTYINNLGKVGVNAFQQDYTSPTNHDSDNNWYPIPIVSNFRNNGLDNEVVMVQEQNNSLTYINFSKDAAKDNLLKKVTQSGGSIGGIVDEITYRTMEPSETSNNLGIGTDLYSSTESAIYPYVEIRRIPNSYLVEKIKNTALGIVKSKDYKYRGYVVNIDGIGFLGFNKTANSSWYVSNSDKKIWSVTESNPLQRGVILKTFSVLLDGTQPFNFEVSYSNLISKSESVYTNSTNGTFPSWVLLQNQTTTDFLTNVIKKTEYLEYTSPYFLPRQVKTSNYLGTVLHGSNLTVTEFDSNILGVGSNYYIGRPWQETTTTSSFVDTTSGATDTKTAKTTYTYTNGNITKVENNSNNDAGTLIEEREYYPNGLLKNKKISQTGFPNDLSNGIRITQYTYDPSNRFISTIIDPELLVNTNVSFHSIYGLVTQQKNHLNQLTDFTYDNWGKQIKAKDVFGISTNTTYARVNNIYTTTVTKTDSTNASDGSSSVVEQNVLAQEVRKGSKDINGNWVYVATEYDFLGRKKRQSEPYFGTASPTQWNSISYDDYSRVIQNASFTGKIVAMQYNGVTAIATDPVMSKSKTVNANGVVVSATDSPGGTIIFKYDANGNVTETLHEGISTKITYDNWGRKTTMDDPSADMLYEYSYNAYGELKTEKTPKGITTFNLSPLGRLISKSIVGDNTNIVTTYNYDADKLLTDTSVLNSNNSSTPSTYVNSFDSFKRIFKVVENLTLPNNVTTTFTKQFSFDSFNRVQNEILTGVAHAKTSTKTITHVYKNNYKWQMKDGVTVLWQANSTDARGNLTSATLGNGIAINNTIDQYGYISKSKHDLGATNVMTLDTKFEPVLGNLLSRNNSMFDERELFTYDENDRMTSWSGNAQNLLTLPFNTSTDGFTFIGGITKGSVSNVTGTLKVVLKQPSIDSDFPVAAERSLSVGLISGDQIRVRATITNKTGSVGVIVKAIMVEVDPLDPFNYVEYEIGTVENGLFDATYQISDFVSNPLLKLRFIVSPNSPQTSNGGGISISPDILETPNGGGLILSNSTFNVDNLKIDKEAIYTQSYDDKARIDKNGLGTYNYFANKPYRNKEIVLKQNQAAHYDSKGIQNIVYNAFKNPVSISQGTIDVIDFSYNGSQERCAMYFGSTNANKLARPNRRYYSADGSIEVNTTFSSSNVNTPLTTEFVTYIGGDAYSAPVVLKFNGTSYNYFYLHRDYQGTILAITNATGGVVEKRLFDPWGEIKKVQNGAGTNLPKLTFFDRGYTGHEHLESVGLINMNARLYDPKLHRFLSPDTYIQDPYNTQNYNRYSYCWNNPTKHTDITGNFIDFGLSIAIAATVAALSYTLTALLADVPFSLGGLVKTVAIASFSAAVTFGIGEAASGVNVAWQKATFQAFHHAVFQGSLTSVQGGKFWAGFASGAFSSAANSLIQIGSVGKEFDGTACVTEFGAAMNKPTIQLLTGAVMGGAGAALSKGNFWQGAVTGLVVTAFNHLGKHGDSYGTEEPTGVETEEDLISFIKENKTLNRYYNKFSKKWSLFSVSLSKQDTGGPNGHSEGLTNHFKENGYATVTIYRAALSSKSHLFEVVLHEFGHVNSIYIGFNSHIYKTYHKFIAESIDEVYAHKFANRHGNVTMDTPYYRSFEKIVKDSNINFNKIKNLSYE